MKNIYFGWGFCPLGWHTVITEDKHFIIIYLVFLRMYIVKKYPETEND